VSATLVQFPEREIDDIPRMLRRLAEQIEAGQYDEANNVAWAVVDKDGDIVTAPSQFSMDLVICTSKERAEQWVHANRGERVVRVEVKIQEG
jgi:hypothetical protein